MTNGGKTYTGKKAIRIVLGKSAPFQAVNPWVSDTPAYKTRVTVTGNKGTIYFECHYIDVDTSKVAAVVGAVSRSPEDQRQVADHPHERQHGDVEALRS